MLEFIRAYTLIKRNYVSNPDDHTLMAQAISGMVDGLDPHSEYFTPQSLDAFENTLSGNFIGVGLELSSSGGSVRVVFPIKGSPADKAGIKSGDVIIKVDDRIVLGQNSNQVIDHIKGYSSTPVRLLVARSGHSEPIPFNLVRQTIHVNSVQGLLVHSRYAFIRITQFEDDTGAEVASMLNRLSADVRPHRGGHGYVGLSGIILDLRDNPGGFMSGAIGTSALFLPRSSLIVSTRGRSPYSSAELHATPSDYLLGDESDYVRTVSLPTRQLPLAVLVNGRSASAAEIVAGALQDHHRAFLLGTRTFGKGTVQTLINLGHHDAMKLTIARYYTPSGRSIQATGVQPDIPTLDEAMHLQERDTNMYEDSLQGHLPNDDTSQNSISRPDSNNPFRAVNVISHPNISNPEWGDRKDAAVKKVRGVVVYGTSTDLDLQHAIRILQGCGGAGVRAKNAGVADYPHSHPQCEEKAVWDEAGT